MNTSKRPRILVVEDDTALQRTVRRALTFAGFDVDTASDGRAALELVTGENDPPSLILLDLTLPKVDGLALCTQVRGFSSVPIIIMSARDRDEDVIKGLDAGADDYITKPFNVETLLARIRALQRRVGPALSPERSDRLVAGLLTIDFRSREVLYGDRRVRLTATEYKILERLARNPGRVYTYEDLLRSVWGPEYADGVDGRHMVQSHVNRLRRKIEPAPTKPIYVLTHPTGGYVFRRDGADQAT